MTDDEAFVRAVVAAPADDAPRLVYADWLDERGDPRGAYLRAELEWAATAYAQYRLETIRAAAPGLDQAWVCRLSRPPIGICLSRFLFEDIGPPINPSQITALEKRHELKLPVEYRLFLMNVNGGRFVRPAHVPIDRGNGKAESVELLSFHSLGSMSDDVCELDEMMTLHLDPAASSRTNKYDYDMETMFAMALGDGRNLVPIGMGRNLDDNLFIGVGGPYVSQVYLVQGHTLAWDRDKAVRLAGSFAEFLGTLLPNPNGRALSPSQA